LQKSTTKIDGLPALPASAARPHPTLRDYLLLLALACAWSSTYPLTKIGLQSIPPVTFIVARSLIAAGFLLVVLRVRGIKR
jgi:drug/metabolite transporter (DMT)-like permease